MCDYHCDIILESEGEKILKSYPTVTTFVFFKVEQLAKVYLRVP